MKKKIEIEIPEGKELKLINGVYTLVDEQNITERIKTFEDACRELGTNHRLVREWLLCGAGLSSDLDAYLRLRIITEALNEGWKPQFTKGEERWYLGFYPSDIKKYNKLSSEQRLVSFTNFYSSYTHVSTGSCLVFKSKKLAEYAGKQFTDLYIKFCF